MQISFIRILSSSAALVGTIAGSGCFTCDDCHGTLPPVDCRVVPTLSPQTGTIAVGASINLTTSIPTGCSGPIVRTSDPSILRLDVTLPTILVTGLRTGTARVTLLAAADTTLQTGGVYSVGPPLPPSAEASRLR